MYSLRRGAGRSRGREEEHLIVAAGWQQFNSRSARIDFVGNFSPGKGGRRRRSRQIGIAVVVLTSRFASLPAGPSSLAAPLELVEPNRAESFDSMATELLRLLRRLPESNQNHPERRAGRSLAGLSAGWRRINPLPAEWGIF